MGVAGRRAAASGHCGDHGARKEQGDEGKASEKPSNKLVALLNFLHQCLQDI